MKIYTIIGGVNGVGKSSLTGVLAAENRDLGVIIDTDKITASFGGDKIKGGKAAIEKINDCLKRGINFTQETTLSGYRTLKTIQKARELDYFIRLYYVGVNSADESLRRIKKKIYDINYLNIKLNNPVQTINSYLGIFSHYKSLNIKNKSLIISLR